MIKRSSTIIIGSVLAGLIVACSTGEEVQVTEVCVDTEMTILPEVQCEGGGGNFIYTPGGSRIGAHGSKYVGSYTSAKPALAAIGRAPSSGGFGTHGGTAGG